MSYKFVKISFLYTMVHFLNLFQDFLKGLIKYDCVDLDKRPQRKVLYH